MNSGSGLIISLLFFISIAFSQNMSVSYPDVNKESDTLNNSIERNAAIDFLKGHNVKVNPSSFKAEVTEDDFHIYSDHKNKMFVIIASSRYFPYMRNPVLAYSFESTMGKEYGPFVSNMIKGYVADLEKLAKERSAFKENNKTYFMGKNITTPILLGKTAWGQKSPYNYFCPVNDSDEKSVVGCVAVSLAHIMHYYKYPQKGSGKNKYLWAGNSPKELELDFSTVNLNWDLFKDNYKETVTDENEIIPIGELMIATSVAVSSNFGEIITSASSTKLKKALINHFDYKSSCVYISSKRITYDSFYTLLYNEISEMRPVIVSAYEHSFVCDGYDGDYLHFNLGWNGYQNGYYRTDIINKGYDSHPYISDMIIGIEPKDDKEKTTKKIILKKAGMLSSALSEKEKRNLTKLKIEGKINSDDIRILRRMCGAFDNDYESWRGTLEYLDLEGAVIEESRIPYKVVDAKISGFKINYALENRLHSYKRNFDFSEMTSDDWRIFCAMQLNKSRDYIIEEKEGRYLISYITSENMIGSYMFDECENLKEIILPHQTTDIGAAAFRKCRSLKILNLPPTIKRIREYAFSYTDMLEKVIINSPLEKLSDKAFYETGEGLNIIMMMEEAPSIHTETQHAASP